MIEPVVSAAAVVLSAGLTAFITYKGTTGKTRSDSLDRAASYWEKAVRELQREVADQRTRLEAVERTNHTLQEENRRIRDALTQVMHWLARNLEHEKSGHGPPPPFSYSMILRYVREALNIQDPAPGSFSYPEKENK